MKSRIPKVIHYCWFGRKPLPKSVKKCIASWKKFCPDYKIVEWNEDNFDINCCQFTKSAYTQKAWAFVSDYARLKVIYDNGGVYLDTDVELVKSLDDSLQNSCFFGRQQDGGYINTGLGFGATKKHPTVKQILSKYSKTKFDNTIAGQIACPIITSDVLDHGTPLLHSNSIEYHKDYSVYPPEYFDPIAHGNSQNLLSRKSFSIHHYDASWTPTSNQLKRRVTNLIGQNTVNKLKLYVKQFLNIFHNKKNLLSSLYYYFIVAAMLFPRGPIEISQQYKIFFSIITWVAVLLASCQSLGLVLSILKEEKSKIIPRSDFIKLFSYFVIIALITVTINGANTTGLQQLFAYPIFFLFILNNIHNHPKKILNTINNVSFTILILNLALSHFFFTGSIHTILIGHVQAAAQIGTLSAFTSIIYYKIYKIKRLKTLILFLLSIFTMLGADAISANFVAILFIVAIIVYKYLDITLFKAKSIRYIICGVIVSIIAILTAINFGTNVKALNFSGRTIVWKSTISNIQESPLYGHGVNGSEIKVFWSQWGTSGNKLTYAHNQILQNLLDGGIIGLIAFWVMFITCIKNVSTIRKGDYITLCNLGVVAFLAISVFESPSLYCYMYIFLALCYSMPKIINNSGRILNEHN